MPVREKKKEKEISSLNELLHKLGTSFSKKETLLFFSFFFLKEKPERPCKCSLFKR